MPLFQRKRTGSVVCPSCGLLVGIADDRCYNCGRWNPGMWGFTPLLRRLGNDFGFVQFVIWSCTALYGTTLLFSMGNIGSDGVLGLLSPSLHAVLLFGASGVVPVLGYGRWWTVLSASWLHGGALHLLFNMVAVWQLGPATADMYGAGRMVMIYVIGGACGFVLSSLAGAVIPPIPIIGGGALTLGASASICALLGALVHYGRRTGSSIVRREAMSSVMMIAIVGIAIRGIDNYAHLGGFVGGYAVAWFFDPLKRERLDHLIGAVVCLVASALAILVSIITGARLFTP